MTAPPAIGQAIAASKPAEAEQAEVRVVVADDHRLSLEQMVSALERHPGCRVVGRARDGEAALELVAEHRPDVVLLDVRMPRLDGLTAARWLRSTESDLAIVIISSYERSGFAAAAAELGAEWVSKSAPESELVDAVMRAARTRPGDGTESGTTPAPR